MAEISTASRAAIRGSRSGGRSAWGMRERLTDTIMSSEPEEEPVSVLQRFEKRLEGLVEGAFAKVFKGVVHPVEILNAMQREAEAHKAILAGGRTLVPNRYVIDLSPYDHRDRKSTRLNSSHANISYAVFCLKKKKK